MPAVMMADASFPRAAARPIVAGHIAASRLERCAVGLRARQNVVPVRNEPAPRNLAAPLVQNRLSIESVVRAVDFLDVLADKLSASVIPWTSADAVPGVHRGLPFTG